MRERESKRVRVREIGGVTNTEEKILRELERRHKWRKKRRQRQEEEKEEGISFVKMECKC